MPLTVMIIAGESSGELYGSLLARDLFNRYPDIRVFGVGGVRMKEEGVEIISNISSAFGITEALSTLWHLKKTYTEIIRRLKSSPPDIVVLIDFPDFNLKVAKEAKRSGIKVLYYVSPQVWAWRRGRIRKIGSLCDRIATILPFEEDIIREKTDTKCEFVGHPVAEETQSYKIPDINKLKKEFALTPDSPIIGLLPGSRHSEVKRHLPILLKTVRLFKKEYPEFQYIIPFSSNLYRDRYKKILDSLQEEGVVILDGKAIEVLSVSQLAVITSGTATFQAALIGVPMVVIYRLFPITYLIGKLLVKVKYISLVNLILQREVVKELIQIDAQPFKIINELKRIHRDDMLRKDMLESFKEIRSFFKGKEPTKRVVEIIEEMLE